MICTINAVKSTIANKKRENSKNLLMYKEEKNDLKERLGMTKAKYKELTDRSNSIPLSSISTTTSLMDINGIKE